MQKIVLKEIAREAGVSTATVSRSLRQSHLIHPATRSRIVNIALRLGYKGRSGNTLRIGQGSTTLGILLEESRQTPPSSASALFLQGVTLESEGNRITLQIEKEGFKRTTRHVSRDVLPAMVKNRLVGALILQGEYDPAAVLVLSQLLPVISFQWRYGGTPIDLVESENEQGIRQIVEHLAARGHRRIAWVNSPQDAVHFRERTAGFCEGCRERGLAWSPENLLPSPFSDVSHDAFARALQAAIDRGVTAFACATDHVAEAVALQLSLFGKTIPKDVSLVGYGAEGLRVSGGKRLTSFDPESAELGRIAVRVALQRLAHPLAAPIIQRGLGRICAGQTVGAGSA